jgi:hypothetical protein
MEGLWLAAWYGLDMKCPPKCSCVGGSVPSAAVLRDGALVMDSSNLMAFLEGQPHVEEKGHRGVP